MAAVLPTTVKLNFLQKIPQSNSTKRVAFKPAFCLAVEQVEKEGKNVGILCEPCNGTGWVLCDFCNGQKTNVKSQTNRIYRRCPSCKEVASSVNVDTRMIENTSTPSNLKYNNKAGYILCTKCKVFKCVTFPDQSDGEELSF